MSKETVVLRRWKYYKIHCNLERIRRRANARNVSFRISLRWLTEFTLSTQLVKPNYIYYCVHLLFRRSHKRLSQLFHVGRKNIYKKITISIYFLISCNRSIFFKLCALAFIEDPVICSSVYYFLSLWTADHRVVVFANTVNF